MILLESIKKDFKNIKFKPSNQFQWSPESSVIYYDADSEYGDWSLLHEVGHTICKHKNYSNDLRLLIMEVEAWQKARKLAKKYNYAIDEDHIEKCLDSYRDWLYKRGACPKCTQAGLETETGYYQCINCHEKWVVSKERFCRVYRKTVRT